MPATAELKVDFLEFREHQLSLPLRPYEALQDVDRRAARDPAVADRIIERGWVEGGFEPIKVEPPIAWEEVCAENRSWEFKLQSWNLLGPVLASFSVRPTDRAHHLDRAVRVAHDWVQRYPTPDVPSNFAWYDMAVGLRACRLGFILDAALRADHPDELLEPLMRSAVMHAELMLREELFAAHSNHGLYLTAGQMALAKRFPTLPLMDRALDQGEARMDHVLKSHFSVEGVHLEHSPDYHRHMLDTFERLISSGVVTGARYERLRDQLEDSLAWFIRPDGKLAAFGDSSPTQMSASEQAHARNPSLRFAATKGAEGEPPTERLRAFPQSGYAAIRDVPRGASTDELRTYLAHACGFHSQTHKHADDLAFIWFDHGVPIILEPGYFGYLGRTALQSELRKAGFRYSDPRRIYVESTRAHNTVEIDDRSHERTGVSPYGSALGRTGTQDGIHFIESEVRHRRSIRHARVLLLNPGLWLIVFDWLWDNLREPHAFSQRFHFAPSLDLTSSQGQLCLRSSELPQSLFVTPLLDATLTEPVRGQEQPELLGWLSPRAHVLTPTWTAAYRAEGATDQVFATLLMFAKDRPTMPDISRNVATASGRSARFEWDAGQIKHRLTLSRPAGSEIDIKYRTEPAKADPGPAS